MPTHYKGTTSEKLALDAFIKLLRSSSALSQRLSRRLEEKGITATQFAVLETLLHLGPLCLSEIARKLLQSGGNLTLVARNLEKQGMVERVTSPQDKRFVSLKLTAKGRGLITRLFRQHLTALTKEMAVLRPSEQQELARLCKRLGLGKA